MTQLPWVNTSLGNLEMLGNLTADREMLEQILWEKTVVANFTFGSPPLPSNRHHLSCGDRLEGKGENYQVCSVQYCVQQLCTVRCTHI